MDKSEKTYIKTYVNDDSSKQVTVFLHIDDASHDEFSNVYIIPGTFHSSDYPPDAPSYITFPQFTGIYVEWISERKLLICASRKPEINTFSLDSVSVDLVIGRHRLDTLEKEGKEVIWDKITDPDVYREK